MSFFKLYNLFIRYATSYRTEPLYSIRSYDYFSHLLYKPYNKTVKLAMLSIRMYTISPQHNYSFQDDYIIPTFLFTLDTYSCIRPTHPLYSFVLHISQQHNISGNDAIL